MPAALNKYKWYPPAETMIPLISILKSLLPANSDFNQQICSYLGVKQCILANSGRTLLTLLLQVLYKQDNKQRDEVLIPGYTCYSVAASIARAGLKIRTYDIEPETFYPDMDSVKKNINGKILAILSQHLFGIPISIDELHDLAQKNHITHIEDTAQGLGGNLLGRSLGTTGDYGLFSFGRGKPLPLGCGGALIGSDKTVMERICAGDSTKGYKQLAITACAKILSHPGIYGFLERLPLGLGQTVFYPNFSVSSMPEAVKRLGAITLSKLNELNAHRNCIAKIYTDNLPIDRTVPVLKGSEPVYTRFPVMTARQSIPRTLRKLGVRRMYPKAINKEPAIYSYLADRKQTMPGAMTIAQNLITLPTHSGIAPEIAGKIADRISNYYL